MSRRYKEGQDREQGMLLPPSVEEYVSKNNPVRAIDAYVDSLDLKALGYANTEGGVREGQPAYAPGMLLKLYIYGYLMRIRSSRRLEQETYRNLEVMWLLQGLHPTYKTIANFRSANAKALRQTNRNFIFLCRDLDLYGKELVAIDGSFFRGNASSKSIFTGNRLKGLIQRLDRDIARYFSLLDDCDQSEAKHDSSVDLQDKLKQLRECRAELEEKQKRLEESGDSQLSEVDPDARRLQKHGQNVAGYNVQIAVDSKHKLLVASEVTNDSSDVKQLAPMAAQAKQVLEVESLAVAVDTGYHSGPQLSQCEEMDVTVYVPERAPSGPAATPDRVPRAQFTFDATRNAFKCPQGQWLMYQRTVERNGSQFAAYVSRRSDCAQCPMRNTCLGPNSTRREMYRGEHEDVVQRNRARMATAGKAMLKLRACLAEHPFGTLKRWCGMDHFLVRTMHKVRGEFSLMTLCYNFKRVLNVLGLERFQECMAGFAR